MKLIVVTLIFLICSHLNASNLFILPEAGLSYGSITQNRTQTQAGFKLGFNLGYKFNKTVPLLDLQYHRFSTAAIENDSIELHSFPIGVGIKYLLSEKLYLSYAFYFDNALYKNLSLSPLGYSYVFESNNSWRIGAGYVFQNPWHFIVHYEKYFLNKIKYKQPITTTADLVTAIEMHFISFAVGYLF